jgi:hypothetical protein
MVQFTIKKKISSFSCSGHFSCMHNKWIEKTLLPKDIKFSNYKKKKIYDFLNFRKRFKAILRIYINNLDIFNVSFLLETIKSQGQNSAGYKLQNLIFNNYKGSKFNCVVKLGTFIVT